jgi:hypothetical protein|tara:strand:- start:737 stop:1780 length:1044 start_codon:yes stop_codon:yes gene_type:complete
MEFKSFSTYLKEEKGEITFAFGRFNPPTVGHEKLFDKLKSVSGGTYRVYGSKSQDPKKNPLNFKQKVKFLRKMFPKHARSIMADGDVRHVMDIATKLYDQGFTAVSMVAGSDRVKEFEVLLNKYNGVKAKHGFYEFKDGVKIISAGERDPDAEGVTGMSASKMRAAAAEGDAVSFAKGVPSGYDSKDLFNTVRKEMGIKESPKFREHVELPKVSNTREEYVEGNLFAVGDEVVLKETNDIGVISVCGTNYLVVEFGQWRKRVWLDQVELVENCGGVGEPKVTAKYKAETPGEEPGPIKLKSFKDMQEKGLWDNIHKKRKSGRKMNPKGHPDAPTEKEIKAAQGKKKK